MQMAYAWFPRPDAPELRYISTTPGQREFTSWRVDVGKEPVPSLAAKSPLLGWHEREIMEMSGIAFAGHPEPERLVSAFLPQTARGPLEPSGAAHASAASSLAAPTLPQVSGKHVQLLPFGPVRADVVESAQFIFYYVGEGILHYHPNLFLKHRGMEKQFEGIDIERGILLAERVSGVDTVAHALAYAQAVEDASGCIVPPRAVASCHRGGTRAYLQPFALPRSLVPHDHAKGWRGPGQAAGGAHETNERACIG